MFFVEISEVYNVNIMGDLMLRKWVRDCSYKNGCTNVHGEEQSGPSVITQDLVHIVDERGKQKKHMC